MRKSAGSVCPRRLGSRELRKQGGLPLCEKLGESRTTTFVRISCVALRVRRHLREITIGSESLEKRAYQQVSVGYGGSEQPPTEDLRSDNETRAAGINVCTPIEELEGCLKAVQDNNRLAKGIQIHHMFWKFCVKSEES